MGAPTSIPRDQVSLVLLLAATAWSALILVVGSLVLIPENGNGVVIILSMPLVLVGLFSAALAWRRVHHKPGPGAVGWILAGLTALLSLVGILTIGIFLMPVAALLFIVCGKAQERRAAYA